MKAIVGKIRLSKQELPIENDAEVFVWPSGWWIIVVISAVTALIGFGLVFSQWSNPRTHQALILIGAMNGVFLVCLVVHTLRHYRYQVSTDKNGITEFRFGRSKGIVWRDILKIETSNMLIMQRFRVFGKDGTILALEFQLAKIDRLIELLLDHLTVREQDLHLPLQFGKKRNRRGAGKDGVHFIEIEQGRVMMDTPSQHHVYSIDSIGTVGVGTKHDQNGFVVLRTVLGTKDGQSFEIARGIADPMLLAPILRRVVSRRG